MIARVIDGAAKAIPLESIILATSTETSDDPLALYVEQLGCTVFRGQLDDVFNRFRMCLLANPCDWFFRISADSPLVNSSIMKGMLEYLDVSVDLITNVQKRTFPPGHSLELLKAGSFSKITPARLSAEELEHVTLYYYRHADEFSILNIENGDLEYGRLNFAVDTVDDLRRMEEYEISGLHEYLPPIQVTHKA